MNGPFSFTERLGNGLCNTEDGRMEIRFYIDPETGLPHIFNHGVTE